MSTSVYDLVTKQITQALEAGVVPWRKPWAESGLTPCNGISGRPYSGINLLLLGLTQYSDHRWLTFRQIQDLGGRVRKGERSSMVVFWKRSEPKVDEETGEVQEAQFILRYYSVFSVAQAEGVSLPEPYVPSSGQDNVRIDRAELLIRSMAEPPKIRHGCRNAWYTPGDDIVGMPDLSQFESADSYYATLFHELGHATGHTSRLARAGVSSVARFGSEGYGHEELVAELTSAFCCARAGLDNSLTANAAAYIEGWLRVIRDRPKTMVIAASQAQRAADWIAGIRPTHLM